MTGPANTLVTVMASVGTFATTDASAAYQGFQVAAGGKLNKTQLNEVHAQKTTYCYWKFKAVGQGFAGGLGPLASSFGVSV